MTWKHPTSIDPENVAVVALGPTYIEWINHCLRKGSDGLVFDEVWTINRGLRCFIHDLVFIMDHLEGEEENDEEYGDAIHKHNRPIITSQKGRFTHANEYPLDWVMQQTGAARHYCHNSIPYVLAYALAIGVKRICLFGADYTYPGAPMREDDRANAEYWVGFCEAKGVHVGCPMKSTLLNSNQHGGNTWWYGYRKQPVIKGFT